MDGQLTILRPFKSVSVISRQWGSDNERLCAMESCLMLERFLPPGDDEPGTTQSAGQGLTYRATRAHSISLLTLKAPITTAADDIYKYMYFFIVFQRKEDLVFHVNPLLGRGFT